MKVRQDNTGKTPKIGDKIAYNPPYYKGLEIHTVTGFAKSGLPYLGDSKDTPKTGFVIVESAPEDFSGREREILILSTEEAQAIAWGDSSEFTTILEETVDTRRWVTCHEILVRRVSDGKLFKSYYEKGATEVQDQAPYEYDEPKFKEVFETKEIKTVYK